MQHADLPSRFVHNDTGCRGQIQAAYRAGHRYENLTLRMLRVQPVGKTRGLTTKNQNVPRLKRDITVSLIAELSQQPYTIGGESLDELRPIVDQLPGQVVPVVQSGAANLLRIQTKSGRPHNPQLDPQRHAASTDVARIRRNLGLVEHDMQWIGRSGCVTAL